MWSKVCFCFCFCLRRSVNRLARDNNQCVIVCKMCECVFRLL